MNNAYDDIRSRIAEPPLWWDEHAVPRYCAFGPGEVANIYADEAVLAHIRCQACQADFHVAFSSSRSERLIDLAMRTPPDESIERLKAEDAKGPYLARVIREGIPHYGDPPNVECCAAGPTMNSDMLRVVEYWRRGDEWARDPSLEVFIGDGA